MLPSNVSEWDVKSPTAQKKRSGSGRGRTIFGIVVLLVLLVGLVGVAVGWLGSTSAPRPTGAAGGASSSSTTSSGSSSAASATSVASATSAARGTPADAATQRAIQQMIQQVDQAQAQALANKDPSVMRATSTTDFYNQQAQTNQDLLDNGVTAISLVGIEWGPITVDGNTATATCWETWSTTFDDGTSEQSRDRNLYTLVKDSSGTWRVQADDHPDESASGSGATPTPSR